MPQPSNHPEAKRQAAREVLDILSEISTLLVGNPPHITYTYTYMYTLH